MGLVAVKAVGGGLVAVPGLRVHGGDDPVGLSAFEDAEAPIRRLLDVLAGHGGQEHRCFGGSWIQPLVPQGKVGPVGVADQRVHQRLPGGPVGPVTSWLAGCAVVVLALQQLADLRGQQWRAGAQQPPDGTPQHRDRVLGVTASSKGAESRTRLTPTSPT
jgi:hypothetical protein